MKLTTKRNRWYFWRETFFLLIPIILIVGTIDVFISFMRCSMHPERSAPCSVNRIFAAMYGIILVLVIIFAIISTKKLRKIKKQIENEFLESVTLPEQTEGEPELKEKIRSKPKKLIVKSNKK